MATAIASNVTKANPTRNEQKQGQFIGDEPASLLLLQIIVVQY
jgi:hypothetical protein